MNCYVQKINAFRRVSSVIDFSIIRYINMSISLIFMVIIRFSSIAYVSTLLKVLFWFSYKFRYGISSFYYISKFPLLITNLISVCTILKQNISLTDTVTCKWK
jgi:hypothetical protein